ncbi:MAG: hypothetical protein ACRD8Z_13935, partial [Nitrososphaeraceae archaeon]
LKWLIKKSSSCSIFLSILSVISLATLSSSDLRVRNHCHILKENVETSKISEVRVGPVMSKR